MTGQTIYRALGCEFPSARAARVHHRKSAAFWRRCIASILLACACTGAMPGDGWRLINSNSRGFEYSFKEDSERVAWIAGQRALVITGRETIKRGSYSTLRKYYVFESHCRSGEGNVRLQDPSTGGEEAPMYFVRGSGTSGSVIADYMCDRLSALIALAGAAPSKNARTN